MNRKEINLLKVDFAEPVSGIELPMFRGVMIGLSGNNPLFHNHSGEGFRYSYPKIQYKLVNGCPCILGIDDGAESLAAMMADRSEIRCHIGHRSMTLHAAAMTGWTDGIGQTETRHTYRIDDWLPLNADNFHDYRQARGMVERISLLQRILRGNILSFAKGMDVFFDDMVECTIEEMECTGTVRFKGVELMCFSGFFTSDVVIPQWIGLGKSASLNHGTILRLSQ